MIDLMYACRLFMMCDDSDDNYLWTEIPLGDDNEYPSPQEFPGGSLLGFLSNAFIAENES